MQVFSPSPQFVDPEASPRELAPIRSRVASQLARETVESGGGEGEAACIERRFEQKMADADLVRLMNAPSNDAEARQLFRILRPCEQ